jgi:hypothetical protein
LLLGLAGLVLLSGLAGLVATTWQDGKPVLLTSPEGHLLTARQQAWVIQARFDNVMAGAAANPGSLPVVDGALSGLIGLAASLSSWAPPPPVSAVVGLFSNELSAGKAVLQLLDDADRSGIAPAYELPSVETALTEARNTALAALAQVAPGAQAAA